MALSHSGARFQPGTWIARVPCEQGEHLLKVSIVVMLMACGMMVLNTKSFPWQAYIGVFALTGFLLHRLSRAAKANRQATVQVVENPKDHRYTI